MSMVESYQPPRMLVERVHCYVCAGTGLVPRLMFWKSPCDVCEGQGKRRILIAENLTPADRAMVVKSAIIGQLRPRPDVFPDWLGLKI